MLRFSHTAVVILVYGLFSPVARGSSVSVDHNGECVTPYGVPGFCRPLGKCESLRGLLERAKSRPKPWVFDFLRKSHCWFEGKQPVVCCPFSQKSNSTNGELLSLSVKNSRLEKILSKSCGAIQSWEKILGGDETSPHEFPWMALIGYKTTFGHNFRCGGSLISSRYVLTAAHCVTVKDLHPVLVRLGEHDISRCNGKNNCSSLAIDIPIEKITTHPDYYKPELRNDIALLRLARSVEFKESIRPICLPLNRDFRERSLPNTKGVVVGWGTTEIGTSSSVPRKIILPVVPLDECTKIYRKMIPIRDSQLCAGGDVGRDSCTGDSGGPLQMLGLNPQGQPAYIQHGIVSFGARSCGTKGYPGVYTKVSHYVDWIARNLKE